MCEASPPSGLRCVPLFDWHPAPMKISSTWPKPSSSRTARHRLPSAFRVKLTPVTLPPPPLLPALSPSPSTTSPPGRPVTLVVDDPPSLANVWGESDPPVDGPAAVVPVAEVVGAGPAVEPPVVGDDDCGAVAVCGAGAGLSAFPVDDDVLTEFELGVAGAEVLLVSWVTVAVPPGLAAGAGAVVVTAALAAWSVDSDGFEPPLPLTATVVVGAGATVVLVVAGAAVVGGVVVATVPEAPLAAVPWAPVEAPAGSEAGAV